MKEKIYLVTGASGHLGNNVVRQLLARGEQVRCFIIEKEIPLSLQRLDLEIVQGDIRDKTSLEKLFANTEGKEVIFYHLASLISIAEKINPFLKDINVGGTKNVIEVCKEHGVARLLYCSSVHAIPEKKNKAPITEVKKFNPDWVHGAYAQTKALASQLVMEAGQEGLDVVIVHPSGLIGPGDYQRQGRINKIISSPLFKQSIVLVKGGYDVTDVRDVAQGLIAASDLGKPGETYILSNKYYSLGELLDLTIEITGIDIKVSYIPMKFAQFFALLTEWWARVRRKSPIYTKYALYSLASNSNFSHTKADKELGYTTRPIEETILDTINFIKNHAEIDT